MLSDLYGITETLYEEYDSSAEICNYLEQQGFDIEQGIANIQLFFQLLLAIKVSNWISEYDALSLSQVANITYNKPVEHTQKLAMGVVIIY